MRSRVAEMGRKMPVLRRMEHHERRDKGHRQNGSCDKNTLLLKLCQAARHQRDLDRGRTPLRHRLQGAEPCARRRYRQRQFDLARRRPGYRQIDGVDADLPIYGRYAADPLCLGRGKQASAQVARYPAGRQLAESFGDDRDRRRGRVRADQKHQARFGDDRLHPDHESHRAELLAGQRDTGEGVHQYAHAHRKGAGYPDVRGRTCQQGRLDRRPQGAGAYRGHGAAL